MMVAPAGNILQEAAERYARGGWFVFPVWWPLTGGKCGCGKADCTQAGKHPIPAHGLNEASNDPDVIAAWWKRWPRANIGINCGKSGIVVIDQDSYNGGDEGIAELSRRLGDDAIPETLTARTGGGGRHLIYAAAAGMEIRNSAKKLAPGIDVRGVGGYIVAPPSLHASGSYYAWDEAAPADLPVAMPPRLARALAATSEKPVSLNGSVPGEIPAGERDNTLTAEAGAMRRRGMSAAAIYAALRVDNAARCKPPLADADIQRIAASVGRYDPAPSNVSPIREPKPTDMERPTVVARVHKARDLQERGLPEIGFTVAGILPEGVTLCAGRPKQGKSFLALNLAIAVAAGGRALGDLPVIRGSVLYLTLEGGEHGFLPRLNTMLTGAAAPSELDYATEWPRMDEGGGEAIALWLEEHADAKLVIVDTLQRVRPPTNGRQGVYEQDYLALQPLIELAQKHRVAFLVIHHTRKAVADDPLDTVSGSTGLTGSVDAVWVLSRVRGQDTAVLSVSGRSLPETEMGLQWDDQMLSWRHAGSGQDARRSAERREILRVMEGDGGGPLTPREMTDLLDGDYESVRKLMWLMERSGELRKESRGYVIPL